MRTNTKLFFAKIVFQTFKVFGLNLIRVAVRNKIKWYLNLNEGIDLSIFLFGSFQKKISKVIFKLVQEEKKFFSIIDIGSNVGDKSLTLSKMLLKNNSNFKIYSVEPTQYAIHKQKINLINNPKLSFKIKLCKYFITNNSMPKSTFSSWSLNSKNKHPIHGGSLKKISNNSRKISLDDFVKKYKIKNIKIIKIDTDGHELNVLYSGFNTIKKHKPIIIMEYADYALRENGFSIESFYKFIKTINYKICDLNLNRILFLNVDGRSSIDIVLTPIKFNNS